jgi:hypothetical protein
MAWMLPHSAHCRVSRRLESPPGRPSSIRTNRDGSWTRRALSSTCNVRINTFRNLVWRCRCAVGVCCCSRPCFFFPPSASQRPPIGAADRRARRLRRKHCTKIEGATLGKRFERLLPSDTETRLRASGSGAAGVPDEGEPIRAYPGQRTRRRRQGLDELYGRTNAPAVIATVTTCSFSMSPTLNCQRSSSLLNPRPLLRCRQSRRQSVTYSREA